MEAFVAVAVFFAVLFVLAKLAGAAEQAFFLGE